MKVHWNSVRIFQKAIHLWLVVFLISATGSAEYLWEYPVSPQFSIPGTVGKFTHWSRTWNGSTPVMGVVLVLGLLSVRGVFRPSSWWSSLLIWFIYINLLNRAWMAGSGGQHLIANVLFWNIFLSLGPGENSGKQVVTTTAFWIIRIQLILTYFVTGVYKLLGTTWLAGTAVGIAATDQAFGPACLGSVPVFAVPLTFIVLALQFALPLAVWFDRFRVPVLVIGASFHLATALFMDIPEMGFAFIAVYSIWLSDADSARIGPLEFRRKVVLRNRL